ncbi:MAG: four helix bundle protein [Arenicella sp.]|jgi:four helix bundle protein
MGHPILDKSFNFAIKVIEFCELLDKERKFAVSNQLVRSGTSVGANIRESQNPHSRADFISKLVIAAKEANETEYWPLICKESKSYPDPGALLDDIAEINRLLSSIISSSKRNSKK